MWGAAFLASVATAAVAQGYKPYQPYKPYSPPAPAQPKTSYDWQSGNRITATPNQDGSTSIRGSNMNTGAMWRSTIEANGDQRGVDSRGNMWRYNESTGSYMSSDGTTCIGKGALRTCN
ncbi:hypothetical protein [Phenylobacterium sp. J367]|uniref:hypothetical protein n=1 Tax=Phenylobacterium sp. J367 TaxID=2898435 RepID=UPI002151A823|nr:hypothetical protein [Phenylobacterium sp. J367]MCR5876959.1 hypothetical protein [Phenylobacterium sp. J367]MCR5877027.1 hypothetical protein [Phenylobacterium sp. J367]